VTSSTFKSSIIHSQRPHIFFQELGPSCYENCYRQLQTSRFWSAIWFVKLVSLLVDFLYCDSTHRWEQLCQKRRLTRQYVVSPFDKWVQETVQARNCIKIQFNSNNRHKLSDAQTTCTAAHTKMSHYICSTLYLSPDN